MASIPPGSSADPRGVEYYCVEGAQIAIFYMSYTYHVCLNLCIYLSFNYAQTAEDLHLG